MDEPEDQAAAEETPGELEVARYTVATTGRDVEIGGVAEMTVNDRGDLYLHNAEAGCLGIFAAGQWRFVHLVEGDE